MKVLFVFLNNEYRTFVPPNLAALEAYVRAAGHQTRVFDTSFHPDVVNIENIQLNIKAGAYKGVDYSTIGLEPKESTSLEAFLNTVEEYRPDLIGFSVYGYTIHIASKLSKGVKEKYPDIPIIYGGIEATLHSIQYISEDYVDIVCTGEGEKSLLEVCNRIDRGVYDFSGIPNLWTKDKKKRISNERIGPFLDLDELADPDWSSYPSYHQYSPFNGKLYKMAMMEFSRGCPYSCTYCESTTLKNLHASQGIKKYVRHKSPDKFVRECKTLVDKYGIELFYFVDGTFLVMPDSVLEELSSKFRQVVNRPFFCLTTAPSVTDKRARLLAEMGCVQVNMGVEAGDEAYRKNVLSRPNMTNDTIVNAFTVMTKYGIRTSSFNMIGMPWQKREDVFKTIALNRKAKPDFVNVSIFIPFEGTLLLDRLRREGYVGDDVILGDETHATVNIPDGMAFDEIERIHKVFTLYCKVPDELMSEVEVLETDPVKYADRIAELQNKYLAFSSPLPAALQNTRRPAKAA
jgi:anaerobic magnesium-protoporphyrin IX monomethyl ester cyclase